MIIRALFAIILLAVAAGPAIADDVYVQDGNTALRLAPSDSAPIAWKVNTGHRLIVQARKGAWLKVRSPHLIEPNRNLWVRAALVSAHPDGDAALAAEAIGDAAAALRASAEAVEEAATALNRRSRRRDVIFIVDDDDDRKGHGVQGTGMWSSGGAAASIRFGNAPAWPPAN